MPHPGVPLPMEVPAGKGRVRQGQRSLVSFVRAISSPPRANAANGRRTRTLLDVARASQAMAASPSSTVNAKRAVVSQAPVAVGWVPVVSAVRSHPGSAHLGSRQPIHPATPQQAMTNTMSQLESGRRAICANAALTRAPPIQGAAKANRLWAVVSRPKAYACSHLCGRQTPTLNRPKYTSRSEPPNVKIGGFAADESVVAIRARTSTTLSVGSYG